MQRKEIGRTHPSNSGAKLRPASLSLKAPTEKIRVQQLPAFVSILLLSFFALWLAPPQECSAWRATERPHGAIKTAGEEAKQLEFMWTDRSIKCNRWDRDSFPPKWLFFFPSFFQNGSRHILWRDSASGKKKKEKKKRWGGIYIELSGGGCSRCFFNGLLGPPAFQAEGGIGRRRPPRLYRSPGQSMI